MKQVFFVLKSCSRYKILFQRISLELIRFGNYLFAIFPTTVSKAAFNLSVAPDKACCLVLAS